MPKQIVTKMQEAGYTHFKMYQQTQLWKKMNAKDHNKGYGVMISGTWYWYSRWADAVEEHCVVNGKTYTADSAMTVAP